MPPSDPFPILDLFVLLALIALNGVLAMSELAIVSARPSRLRSLAEQGSAGARRALDLAGEPGRFLSTVQIGITLIGILAGAYSGATFGEPVSQRLELLGLGGATADSLGFGLVIVLTTYVSLVIGELVPKQIALRNPEPIAALLSRPMAFLSRATAPLVWILDKTSAAIFKLAGMNRENDQAVTAEELHLVVAEAQSAGVLEESERAIISSVVRLADRPVREIMTPRTEIDWLAADATSAEIRAALAQTPHSRLPVANGSVDDIVGIVSARDLLDAMLDGQELDLVGLARPAPIIPDLMDAMDALDVLREADVPLALVHDEYGHLDGIVTPGSILIALAGTFRNDEDEEEPVRAREDGSWLVSGTANAEILVEKLGLKLDEDRDYATAAGLALAVLRRLPEEGEKFAFQGWVFEIVDMDGRKIDKLIASRQRKRRKKPTPAAPAA
ncbi:hemolysin family protein [Sphingomicrobium astaxanthinifaciens]|uniref:hemolysin family protein n=1 Tax=Sphingomicrobium astaxanthinifaciens TaxID=1227949 RepID=UPI001FCAD01C|nr:hemolysin family protein [Sphingomicrobium astaxanthinifaciens]MCJ7421394.1 hemolysin family protein [Sphingomicrobium astaxanthinifaciens]